jgi:hypothetical protein
MKARAKNQLFENIEVTGSSPRLAVAGKKDVKMKVYP